jgi:hypothetical protein
MNLSRIRTHLLSREHSGWLTCSVAGNRKISTAIKYLTQSTWAAAPLHIGDGVDPTALGTEARCLIEVEVGHGCIAVPLSKYASFNTRICRPIGL